MTADVLCSLPRPSAEHPVAIAARCCGCRCAVFPVEFIVRGFMTGSTETSLWTHYAAGAREYCGHAFPDGLSKNSRLERNVVTPTTKAANGDVPVSAAEVVDRVRVSRCPVCSR